MRSRLRTLRTRREDGQALVELSLCGSFLVLVLLAVWQFGTIFSNYIDLSEAARAGARAAAISGAPTASGDTASFTTAVSEGTYAAQHGPEAEDRPQVPVLREGAIEPAGDVDGEQDQDRAGDDDDRAR